MRCNACRFRNERADTISRFDHESAMARLERCNLRLAMLLVLLTTVFTAIIVGLWKRNDMVIEEIMTIEMREETDGEVNTYFTGGDFRRDPDNPHYD